VRIINKQFKKAAKFTDIHFGRKNNSELHNQDCIRYIEWFCATVKADPTIDHVIFLGDWHEHRSAINGMTLDYSHRASKMLNELGIPVFFIVGNHDLYYRNNRDIFTTTFFDTLENFIMVNEPIVIRDSTGDKFLLCPFMFEEEYPSLLEFSNIFIWYGHFEFKGFVVTGDTYTLEHGPDPVTFKSIKRIFTGHFHKRQNKNNVYYIGNSFPADFSDANDFERGMATYEYDTDTLNYINWPDCPSYINTKLSAILEAEDSDVKKILVKDSRVNCLVDSEITYDESNKLKEYFINKFKLREFNFDEPSDVLDEILEDTDMDIEDIEMESTSSIVRKLLERIKESKIKPEKLVKIYDRLK